MNKIEDIDFDKIDLSDFQEDVDDIRNDIKNIKKNKKLMKVLKKVEKKKDRDKKTILEIGLYAQYYKKDIFDKYMINNQSLIITNDAIDILDKPQEKLYIEPWTKKIEKDKEIERLKTKLEKIQDIILCYGETFDSKVHQEMQEKILDILEIKIGQAKLGGDDNE